MLHCPIPRKGAHKYGEQELCKFLMEIGRGNAQLHSDNEPALIALIKSTISKMGTGLSFRNGPTYSPQSQRDIERAHGTLLAQLRTILHDTCKKIQPEKTGNQSSTFPMVYTSLQLLTEQVLGKIRWKGSILQKMGKRILLTTVSICRDCDVQTVSTKSKH